MINKLGVLCALSEQSERAVKHQFMSIIDMKDHWGRRTILLTQKDGNDRQTKLSAGRSDGIGILIELER